jgi:D-alanyl-D-alanine carboxypeptidase
LLLVTLFAGSPVLPAETRNTLFTTAQATELTQSLDSILREKNLPSIAVSILVSGKGEYTYVQGYADLATKSPRTLDQPFRIASITKPFAATAILVLVDRGLLNKADTIARWYPEFPYANRITIDDLLRMRSGIPAPNDDEVLARVYDAPLAPAPPVVEELKSYSALKAQFKAPNTVGIYTDFNYDILAGIVLKVTGKNIGTVITENVIKPLKLTRTSYPTGTGVPGGLHGYGWNPAAKRFDDKTLFNPPLAGAAGAVISNVYDMHTFARALCKGTLLKPETFQAQMQGKPLEGTNAVYGEGVAIGDGFCGHSGTINGYSSDMYYIQKLDASLVINVNRLDRDNKSQSTEVFGLIGKTILANLSSH